MLLSHHLYHADEAEFLHKKKEFETKEGILY